MEFGPHKLLNKVSRALRAQHTGVDAVMITGSCPPNLAAEKIIIIGTGFVAFFNHLQGTLAVNVKMADQTVNTVVRIG